MGFFGITMLPLSDSPMRASEITHLVSLAVCAIVTLCFATSKFSGKGASLPALALGCALAAVGSCLIVLTSLAGTLALVLASTVCGVGEAIMCYQLCLLVNPAHGDKNTFTVFSLALVVSTLAYAMLSGVGGLVAALTNAALPVIVYVLVWARRKLEAGQSGAFAGGEARGGGEPTAAGAAAATTATAAAGAAVPAAADSSSPAPSSSLKSFPWKVVLGFAVFGLAFGFLRGLTSSDVSQFSFYYLLHEIIRAVAAVIVLVFVARAHNAHWAVSTFGVGCFVVAFLLTYMPASYEAQLAINAASTLGYTSIELLLWVIIFDIASETRIEFNVIYGFGRGLMQLGIAIGSALALTLSGIAGEEAFSAAFQISIVSVVLVMLICFSTRNVSELWGMERTKLQPPQDSEEALRGKLAEAYGLSPRECDVTLLLMKGRSEPYIAESLFLSRGTVHSHVMKIYTKAGVHSRQELLSRIEQML